MRKADYAALARIISDETAMRNRALDNPMTSDHARTQCVAVLDVLETVARDFARTASVNKDEFLKACGIQP